MTLLQPITEYFVLCYIFVNRCQYFVLNGLIDQSEVFLIQSFF